MAKNVTLVVKEEELEQVLNSAENVAGGVTVENIVPLDSNGAKFMVHFKETTTANPEVDATFYQAFRGND